MTGRVIKTNATVPCLCGGTLTAGMDPPVLLHSLPTCAAYEAVGSMADAAELLEKARHHNAS